MSNSCVSSSHTSFLLVVYTTSGLPKSGNFRKATHFSFTTGSPKASFVSVQIAELMLLVTRKTNMVKYFLCGCMYKRYEKGGLHGSLSSHIVVPVTNRSRQL